VQTSKPRFLPVFFGLLLTFAIVSVTAHSPAFATGSESVLFNFTAGGTGATGSFPHSTLIRDASGNLYGTTSNGGASEVGVVFELSPPATPGGAWTETVLYNFGNYTNDGRVPWTWGVGLATDSQGNLYGTTQDGGTYSEGTAWELSPPTMSGGAWTETVIWNFGQPGVTDGEDPTSGLTIDQNGNLFGTTLFGQTPTNGFDGTVYELSPPSGMSGTWTENVIAQFTESNLQYVNGFYPYAGVIGDGSGNLYGTTSSGGIYGTGINPGGTVFELSPAGGGSWTESVLWNFSSSESDASDPMSALLLDKMGNLYGTSALGGTTTDYAEENNGLGTVFELSPPGSGGGSWSESIPHNFLGGTDGETPESGVIMDPNGNLYGTTWFGGTYFDEPYTGGIAYKLTPPATTGNPWPETILWQSGNLPDGALPWATLLMDPIGNLYGTTLAGGSFGNGYNGTVYEIANAPTTISVAASLALGNSPVGDKLVKNLTVRNTGHANPLFVSVTSSDAEFAPTGTTTCPTTGIAPLTSCTIAIGVTPNALGARSATLSVEDNTATSPQHVALTGTGTITMAVTPASFAFGSVKIGSSKTKSITVHNYQTNAVTLTLPPTFSGLNAGDFSVMGGGTCTSTLGAKSTCTLVVTYAPTALGSEAASMTVTDSPDPLGPYSVSFTTGPTIPATVTPATLAFGTLTARTPSKTKDVTVTNLSGSSLSVGESITGANASDFAVNGGSCGTMVAANSSCTIGVTFTPTGGGSPESASIAVSVGSDPDSPHNISMTGTGP
jgi:uncharacterized repeat protein (TIGR03803 family)